jgi:hypothetical protein
MEHTSLNTELGLSPTTQVNNAFRTRSERKPFIFSSSLQRSQHTFSCNCRNHNRLQTDAKTQVSFPAPLVSSESSLIPNAEGLIGLQRRLGIPLSSDKPPRTTELRAGTRIAQDTKHGYSHGGLPIEWAMATRIYWAILKILWSFISTLGLHCERRQMEQAVLEPPNSTTDIIDAIFISLDFEYYDGSKRHKGKFGLKEVGISTFDTRDVLHPGAPPEKIISTSHYQIEKPRRDFNFGTSEVTISDWIVHHFRQLFHIVDNPDPELRKIVLVGHGIANEIHILRQLGVNLELSPVIVGVFDTSLLARDIMGQATKCRLVDVARRFDMDASNFHNAGNDANYTLRILLMLAMNHCEGISMTSSQSKLVEFYKKMCGEHMHL